MDLRSIINTDGGDTSVSKPAAPVTPIQPPQGYRDYRHPSQSSPAQHGSQDFGLPSSAPYTSPNTYRADPSARPPHPPPLQAPPPQSDYFSPGGSHSAQSAQSPYRQTPSSAVSTGQYPFPQTFQAPQSPAQHQQYPHTLQRGDSYRQSSVPPPHLQNPNQRGSPAPQTPPISVSGSNPYFQHQRSQSSISTPTPTSAQSQPLQYNQYPQDSPVISGHPPPQKLSQSQQSQPATPLGPPLQRQSTGGFTQPTSPYHQQGSSAGPFSTYQHTSPEVRTASIPRQPTTPITSGYDSHRTSTSDPQPKSVSERERSLSISPKTQVSSLPGGSNLNERHPSEDIYMNSSKRKTEDQNSVGEEPRRFESPQARQGVNGNHHMHSTTNSSPHQRPKKRVRYNEPPIWARSSIGRPRRYGPIPPNASKLNGKQLNSHHAMPGPPPAAVRTESNGTRQNVQAAPQSIRQIEQSTPELLGQWEPSILGTRPTDAMTKLLADWIYLKVVSRGDIGELSSRGVEVEIEAKLGQLVDSDTSQRYHVPVQSECILAETGRVRFVSSMTESQHKYLNDFLNGKVQETFPGNPEQTKKRVPIVYKHRYERDRFFELPPSAQAHLPAAVRAQLNPRHTVKVRATYDKKDGHLINKIIKARIADLDIYNPQCPLDCRISVNLEMSWDGDLESLMASEGPRLPDRNKDRLSYTQSHYQIDLTQVSQEKAVNGVMRLEKEHELEIEISTAAVRDQGRKAAMGEPNDYVSLVEGLLDNVRVLARAVPPQ